MAIRITVTLPDDADDKRIQRMVSAAVGMGGSVNVERDVNGPASAAARRVVDSPQA